MLDVPFGSLLDETEDPTKDGEYLFAYLTPSTEVDLCRLMLLSIPKLSGVLSKTFSPILAKAPLATDANDIDNMPIVCLLLILFSYNFV